VLGNYQENHWERGPYHLYPVIIKAKKIKFSGNYVIITAQEGDRSPRIALDISERMVIRTWSLKVILIFKNMPLSSVGPYE
jgi:hypothetical protein